MRDPLDVRTYGCGCKAHIGHMKWCPLHGGAEEMLRELVLCLGVMEAHYLGNSAAAKRAHAAIEKAVGKQHETGKET